MKIYIDTNTGAWGGAGGLVLVDVSEEQAEDLMDRPDSHIINFGLEHGETVSA